MRRTRLRPASRPTYAVLTAAVVLTLAAGCGGGDEPTAAPTGSPTSSASPSATGTPAALPTGAAPTATSTDGTGLGLTPVAGLPTDFPTAEVPLVTGDFRQPLGNGSGTTQEGRKGWILEVDQAQKPEACFAAAAKQLTDHGFTQQPGEIRTATTHQAQFTGPGYAVIISTSASDSGGCRLGYEVGQVAGTAAQ